MWSDKIHGFMQTSPVLQQRFLGVFPADRLPKVWNRSQDCCLIANTAVQSKEGQHWVAFYLQYNGLVEYFDSYGLPPTKPEFLQFLQENATSWRYNNLPCQGLTSETCGHHCLFFLWHRCHGLNLKEILHLFDCDPAKNDAMVKAFVKKKMPGRVLREHKVNMDLRHSLHQPRRSISQRKRRSLKIFGK